MRGLVVLFLMLCSGSVLAEQFYEELVVGGPGYNRLTFGSPYVDIVLPPDAPLMDEPTKLRDKKTILFEIFRDAQDPFMLVAYLLNGDIVTLNLIPKAGAPAASWSNEERLSPPESAFKPIQRPEDAWLEKTFRALVTGRSPDGFTRVKPPPPGRVGPLQANYITAFKNQSYIILVAELHSQVRAMIQPQDLYAPGVKAVSIDGDRVGGQDTPLAYILMDTVF